VERRNARSPIRLAAPGGALALAAVVVLGPGAAHGTVPDAPVELATVLKRLDRIAALYRDNALRFTCDETLTHFTGGGRRQYRFHYIFVHDDDTTTTSSSASAPPRRSSGWSPRSAEPVAPASARRVPAARRAG
jgi:hypothetical protein